MDKQKIKQALDIIAIECGLEIYDQPEKVELKALPATDRQLAFLKELKIPYTLPLSKDQASALISTKVPNKPQFEKKL